MALVKEVAGVVKAVTGHEVATFASMGSQVGELVSVVNFGSWAEYEEATVKLLASSDWQAVVKKFEGVTVPGASRDHFLRQI
ncbi:MAG TPA: hypothetical protein VJY34_16590 [Roseiarcus sp.]|nr:hypothetical protein [Roseiarcus sp.]